MKSTRLLWKVVIPAVVISVFCVSFGSCKSNSGEKGDAAGEKKWKLTVVKYEDLQQTEDTERGLLAGLRDVGLEEGRDYELVIRSAQGDIPTVLSLVDVATTDGTDLLISLQTPTLHAAVKRATKLPIVFMVVANPFVISTVGESDSIHLPNVTGVYTMTTFERMISLMKQCLPDMKKIGTLYSSQELNATYYKSQLLAAANNNGLQLETFPVNSRLDVDQSMQALCNKGIDAICQIEDNLTSSTFQTIAQVARRYKLPVFSFVNAQAQSGSSIVVAPDYYAAAREAATVISNIMKGTSPAVIPFQRIKKFHLIANPGAAEQVGMRIPEQILNSADEIVARKSAAKE